MQKIGETIKKWKAAKPPAYPWQDLALRVIGDLNIPNFKKSAVFKACRDNSKIFIERCLNDTKELCKTGEKWKYFFKVLHQENNNLLPAAKTQNKF